MGKKLKRMSAKRLFSLASLLFIIMLAVTLLTLSLTLGSLPKLDTIEDYKPPRVSRVYDRSGILVGEFYTERRTLINVEELPSHVKNAFLAAEDAEFYNHKGIDYWGLMRAVLAEVKYQLVGGQRIGGSTITQQTAKTMLLGSQRTYTRKLKELWLAKKIEDQLTKNEILNLYLNQIYFGNGAYGVEEAAQTYYGVSAKNLSLAQAAALAAVPKSPNKINPLADETRVRERRNYVLHRMVENTFITQAQAENAKKEPVKGKSKENPYLGVAPYFVEAVRRVLADELGDDMLNNGGLSIYTSVDAKMQEAANLAFKKGLQALDKRHGYRGPSIRLPSSEQGRAQANLKEIKAPLFKPYNTKQVVWDLSQISAEALSQDPKALKSQIYIRNLKVGQLVGARVVSVSDTEKSVTVDLGTTHATLPFSAMGWARTFNPETHTPAPKAPSKVLQAGDIILVKIEKLTPAIQVSLEQIPKVEGALLAIDPHNHRIRSMVGGYDFARSSFNRATQARRQPGSAFKAFVYAGGFEKGVITPATVLKDEPKVYMNEETGIEWKPRNSTNKFVGDVTVRTCLFRSINMCSITILEKEGMQNLMELTKRLGLMNDKNHLPRDLTLALGSGEVAPIDLVNAYSVFPAGGKIATPILIERVVAADGDVLREAAEPEEHQALSPQSAFITTNLMRSVIDRTAGGLTKDLRRPLAGKTGTTNNMRSTWFVGFSPDIVAGVYVGFDDNLGLGANEYGIRNALPIWIDFMRTAQTLLPESQFEQPPGIVWRLVDDKTGLLSDAKAPDSSGISTEVENPDVAPDLNSTERGKIIWEAFIEGTEPDSYQAPGWEEESPSPAAAQEEPAVEIPKTVVAP